MSGYKLLPDQSLRASDLGLNCTYCHSLLREAVQTLSSGIRLCENCFKKILSLPKNERPRDISIKDENDFMPDMAARRDVAELAVQCKSCPWKGMRRDWKNHECNEEESLEVLPASRAGGYLEDSRPSDPMQTARSIFQQATPMVEEQQQLLQDVGEQQSQQQDVLSGVAQQLPPLPQAVTVPLLQMCTQQLPPPMDGIIPWMVVIPPVDESRVCLQSPPFYTGRTGYKMCVRAIFRAGTAGNEICLSLYFTVMRGQYNCFLKWPFSSKVSLILVDPNHRKHIVKSFRPNPQSSSYFRPVSEMNIPMGFPNFASVSEDYMRENSVFIKCIVDTSNIVHP